MNKDQMQSILLEQKYLQELFTKNQIIIDLFNKIENLETQQTIQEIPESK